MNIVKAILSGGLLVAVLDGLDAMVVWGLRGVPPERVWQGVAVGLVGRESFQGGLATTLLGLEVHFLIAFTAAALYVRASRILPLLVERPFLCGPLYGLAVHAFMQQVVIPLSAIMPRPQPLALVVNGFVAHIFFVGLPIALCTRRFLPAPSVAPAPVVLKLAPQSH